MSDAKNPPPDELTRLQAEIAELRQQAEVAQLKAEADRLRAQLGAPTSPPALPPAAPPPAAERKRQPSPRAPAGAATVPPPAPKAQATVLPETVQYAQVTPAKVSPAAVLPAAAPVKPVPAAASAAAPAPSADGAHDEHAHSGWSRFRAMGSMGTSAIFHCAIILVLSLWVIPPVIKSQLEELQATEIRPDEQLTKVLEEETTPSTELAVAGSSASGGLTGLTTGHGTALQTAAAPAFAKTVSESVEGPAVTLADVDIFGVPGEALNLDVPEGAPGEPAMVVDSLADAMDHITQELLMLLIKSDVLVLWLFDQSESMKDDQQEIKERVYRVYEELGLSDAASGDRLLTAVGSYGKDFMLHTEKPTNHISEIKAAIDMVPNDPSGKENQCPAIGLMIEAHRKYASGGRRKLALIMVTDESGEEENNALNLEPAIQVAKETRTHVYILGREAVFGYPYAFMTWTEPMSGLGFWLPINRGPETPFPEQLQTNGFYRRYDAHASGFGPYEQARMARETGGVFFLLPSPEVNLVGRDDRKYALQAMRPYLPDLSPRAQYAQERDASELRRTLWQVITDLNPYNPKVQPHIEMRHSFSINPSDRLQQIAEEHERAKRYFLYLHAAEEALEKIKRFRSAEASARWRANYDLLYAQVIAYKVRLYEYGAYMEFFAKTPKPLKNPFKNVQGFPVKTTHWELTTRQEMLTLETTQEYMEKSKAMFQAVIQQHAGTPYSARAEWELARGFGVELVEDFDDPRRAALGIKLPNL